MWGGRQLGTVVHLYAETYSKTHDECMALLTHCTFEENPFAGIEKTT